MGRENLPKTFPGSVELGGRYLVCFSSIRPSLNKISKHKITVYYGYTSSHVKLPQLPLH